MAETMNIAEIRQRAKMPAKQAGGKTVQGFFEHNKSALSAVLPQHIKADRLMKIALGALRQTPKLAECSVESLFGATVWCAQLGLEPNTPMGHAYLIPFKKKGAMEVQCIIGYRGMIDLARRSGQIVSIAAHEVCANDEFEFSYGLDEKLSHKPSLSNRGPVIAYYAVAKLVGGGYAYEVMSVEQIEAIRDRDGSNAWKDEWEGGRPTGTRTKASSPWWDHPVEMGRKSVIRRLFKYLPVSIELADAVQADESFGKQKFDNVLEGEANVIEDPADDEQQAETAPPAIEHQAPPQSVPTGFDRREEAPAAQNQPRQAGQQRQPQQAEPERWEPSPEELAEIAARERAEAGAQQALIDDAPPDDAPPPRRRRSASFE